jgi:hypothetical protein
MTDDDDKIVRAWTIVPFTPLPNADELSRAYGIREKLRERSFDLRLGADGAVLIADLMAASRTPPPILMNKVWENAEAIAALMEDEEKAREMRMTRRTANLR